ncbi:MAG: penicillin-binding protein 2 [Candidatus Omnitrophota bacterium]
MKRIKIVNFLVNGLFLFIGLNLVNLQVVQGHRFRTLSDKNCIRLIPQAGARGRILDRQGHIIVDNKLAYDVMVLPQDLNQHDETLLGLSKVLGSSLKDLKDALRREYVAASVPVTVAKNIDTRKAIALEELKQDLPGIIIQQRPKRAYPYASLGCHILGYVGAIDRWRLTKLVDYGYKTKDLVGFGGLEEKYDYYLRQEEGGLSVEVDHRGRLVRTLGFRPPHNGKDVQLTVDLNIQKIVDEELAYKKGCVVIMDPNNGEIIALASAPHFDPSLFVDRTHFSVSDLFNDPDAPFINRAMSGTYPAGSVFKLVLAVAGLETKKLNLNTSFLCNGSVVVGRKKFLCWDTHGQQGLIKAIAHSCNVFFYRTGLILGAQTIYDYALKFGFSKPTSFELPYEASGFIPSPLWRKINKFKNWYDGDTVNVSIGQGEVLVTPLQVTRMMAVFANGGYLVTPYIVQSIGGNDISGYHKKIVHLPFKTENLEYIKQGLREAIALPSGTGHVIAGLSVSVAGKTGTAQTGKGTSHAWFVGFFPSQRPKYVMCVFLEKGGPGYVSCVLARRIIERMINEGFLNDSS